MKIGPYTTGKVYQGDCLELMKAIPDGAVGAVVTDPPYKTASSTVPIMGKGVGRRIMDTQSVGMPWGYAMGWIEDAKRISNGQLLVFCNYHMMGDLCSLLTPTTIFVWHKPNAPRMMRPVPRLDCEFIIWDRGQSGCGDMKDFKSMLISLPMLQAGCMATERILGEGKRALHPCQKPLDIVKPFLDRMEASVFLDPFMGTGTTGVACVELGREFLGFEIDPDYCKLANDRIAAAKKGLPLKEYKAGQKTLFT